MLTSVAKNLNPREASMIAIAVSVAIFDKNRNETFEENFLGQIISSYTVR